MEVTDFGMFLAGVPTGYCAIWALYLVLKPAWLSLLPGRLRER